MTRQAISQPQHAASDPRASAWVNANAGSGKTHVLVERVIRLMLSGADPARILCLTFTKAAAAEMAGRLYERLGSWIALDDDELSAVLVSSGVDEVDEQLLGMARRLFTRALETPGGLKIQTIHAFCEKVLQHFPVEAGIAPHFKVMDDRAAQETIGAVRDRILLQARSGAGNGLSQALHRIVHRIQAEDFDKLFAAILSQRADLEDMLSGSQAIDGTLRRLRQAVGLEALESEATIVTGLAIDREAYRRLTAALAAGSGKDPDRGRAFADVLRLPDADLRSLKAQLLTDKYEPRAIKGIATKSVREREPWIESFIGSEQQRLKTGLEKLDDLDRLEMTGALLLLAAAMSAEFEAEKRQRASYDFDDLIARTSELLASRPSAAWVLYKLDGGIEHVLVDEAQDTSPTQWRILRSLTEEFFAGEGRRPRHDRTMFAVGDRKQSIFSFQGADPNVFEIAHEDFKRRVLGSGQPFNDVDFTVSYRSTPEILQAVDTVFETSQPARRGLDGRQERPLVHQSNRRDRQGLVEIWRPFGPSDSEDPTPWMAPVDEEPGNSPRRRLARHIASAIKSWIGNRLLRSDNRPVRAADILILVRQRNGFFDAVIRELRQAGIPVAGADRLKIAQSIAVQDILALARFCLLPDDDHSLACILKSPLVPRPLDEDQLFGLCWERGPRSLWRRLSESPEPACSEAARQLGEWLSLAQAARPYEFLAIVLQSARRPILARLGSEANDALDALLELALVYERDHASSLAGFLTWFAAGETEIKRNMEQSSDEVRIMTVHGSKGLEAPIVILPDTMTVPDGRNQSNLMMVDPGDSGGRVPLWKVPKLLASPAVEQWQAQASAEQANEYRRLLYVAMTRARDELYVCGHRGKREPPADCWYNMIVQSLVPSMRELPDGAGWRLGAEPRTKAVEQPSAESRVDLPQWLALPAASWGEDGKWAAPSRLAGHVPPLPGSEDRQLAIRRGNVLHALLQHIPALPEDQRPVAAARMARRAGFGDALANEVLAILDDPATAPFFAADGMVEVPLAAHIEKLGRTVIARIDRLIVRDDRILVLDYKSDRDVPATIAAARPEYLLQLAAYREGVRGIHGARPVRVALLWTAIPRLMEVPPELLDRIIADHKAVGHT